MIKITTEQYKIFIAVALTIAIISMFYIFIYKPEVVKLNKAKEELKTIEAQMQEARFSIKSGSTLADTIIDYQSQLASMKERFSSKEESVYRTLIAAADKLGIDIRSLKPGKKHQSETLASAGTLVKDFDIIEVQIALSFKTTYKQLGDFFRVVQNEIPVVVRVDNVTMTRSHENVRGQINVELDMTAFLLQGKDLAGG